MEVWARGNNVWRQLEFCPSSSSHPARNNVELHGMTEEGGEEEREPWNLDVYRKVFEAEGVEWVGSDGLGSIGKFGLWVGDC